MAHSLKILFLCPRLPYPPIKGDCLRAFYQIRELVKYHKLTLLTFSEVDEIGEDAKVLEKMCEKVIIIKHKRREAVKSMIYHLFTSLPMQCAYYQSKEMQKQLREIIANKKFDVIHIQLIRMMPYIISYRSQFNTPVVLDFVDALSLNMYKRLLREELHLKMFFFYEWYKTKKYEYRLRHSFQKAIVTSPFDSKILSYDGRLEIIPNGVDLNYFTYYPDEFHIPNTIIFSGNMSYFPNIDAVLFFYHNIFPKIKKAIPEIKFKIVGTNPAPSILKLNSFDRDIIITGYVDNIAEHLGKSAIAIAPMLSGSGIQNKILEAMAVGTPVVATKLATNAIRVTPEENILLADTPDDFADCVIKLLKDGNLWRKISLNARKLVEREYTWEKIVKKLETVYKNAIGI
ncbi:MAG: glycosyltransferase [candidate division WOR-3 bacterium]|nr:glycosyltransferase [candidate division WOR-3 bacterium]